MSLIDECENSLRLQEVISGKIFFATEVLRAIEVLKLLNNATGEVIKLQLIRSTVKVYGSCSATSVIGSTGLMFGVNDKAIRLEFESQDVDEILFWVRCAIKGKGSSKTVSKIILDGLNSASSNDTRVAIILGLICNIKMHIISSGISNVIPFASKTNNSNQSISSEVSDVVPLF